MMAAQTTMALRLILLLYCASAVYAACYFPSGRLAPNDSPCRDDTTNSVCCGQGYACLSNGLCQATGEELLKDGASEFVRGGCTDKSFRSSSCPLICIDPEVNNVDGGHGVGKCEDTDLDMYYCIDANLDSVDCDSGAGVLFFAGTPSVITIIGVSETTTSEGPKASSTEPSADISTEITTTSSSSEASTSAEAASTRSTDPATTSEPPSPGGLQDDTVNKGAIIGGAIGGFFILVIVVAVVWWLLRKRRGQSSTPSATQVTSQTATYKDPYVAHETQPGWHPAELASEYQNYAPAPQELPASPQRSRGW